MEFIGLIVLLILFFAWMDSEKKAFDKSPMGKAVNKGSGCLIIILMAATFIGSVTIVHLL